MDQIQIDGALIRQIRKLRDITLSDLAKRTELSYDFIRKVETEIEPISIASVEKVAAALDVDPIVFIKGAIPTSSLYNRTNGDRPKLVVGPNEWIVPDDLIEPIIKMITAHQNKLK